MPMIGQEELRLHLEGLAGTGELHKLILLAGPRGQGRYTLAKHVAEQLGDVYEPENKRVDDIRQLVEDSYSLSRTRVYILKDADEMTVQAQNALLKFAEEPATNAYIVMTIEHENNILPTIKSRGMLYELEVYSREQLEHFTGDEVLLEMFSNPGQISQAQSIDINKLIETSKKVVDNIHRVSVANVFNIMDHFKDYEKDMVITVLLHEYAQRLRRSDEKLRELAQIRVLYKYTQQLKNRSINKDNAFEMMFIELREKSMEEI